MKKVAMWDDGVAAGVLGISILGNPISKPRIDFGNDYSGKMETRYCRCKERTKAEREEMAYE